MHAPRSCGALIPRRYPMHYRLTTWTPVITEDGRFHPEDLKEAIESAWIFYHIKKDRGVENAVRRYLMSGEVNLEDMLERVRQIVRERHPLTLEVEVLKDDTHSEEIYVEPYVISDDVDDEGFRARAFTGSVLLNIKGNVDYARLRAVGQSYAEGILKAEMKIFGEESELLKSIYQELLNEMKNEWDIPLRMGIFNRNRFGGNLLFFWRIKDVRDYILRKLKFDIRPSEALYIVKYRTVPGFVELRRED